MDTPRYTVTITSRTRGWSVSATHGTHPDITDPAVRVVPTAPFAFSWGFVDDLIPGTLEPDRVTFSLWSRTSADEPALDLGDIVAGSVHLGDPAGPVIARIQPSLITEVETDLVPGSAWRVRTTVAAASHLATLPSGYPTLVGRNFAWQHRWGLIGQSVGLSVGKPATPIEVLPLNPEWTGSSAGDHAAELLATFVPGGVHHALVPYSGAGYPAGYSYVDQGYTVPAGADPAIPDPGTDVKLLIAPASRTITGAWRLPLAFYEASGVLDVISSPAGPTPSMPAVSARYCDVPATVRRSRDHLINTVILKGINLKTDETESRPSTYTRIDAGSVATYGRIARTLETQLVLAAYDADPSTPGPVKPSVPALADSYLVTNAGTRAYKEFTIRASDMPDNVAAAVLPYLTPSYPGDGADGRVVRHLTIHSLPAEVTFPAADPSGYITSGTLAIDSTGAITYTVNVTPGRPGYPVAPTPVTVGEFTAAGYSTLTVPHVSPAITVADLDLVDA